MTGIDELVAKKRDPIGKYRAVRQKDAKWRRGDSNSRPEGYESSALAS